MNVLESVLFYLNGWFFFFLPSRARHHISPESALCPRTCRKKNSPGVCVDLSVWVWCTSLCVKACVCLCVCVCVLWGWCGMEVTSVRSNIQAHAVMWRALSRDNHKAAQVQLPPVLFFPLWHTNTHTHKRIDGRTQANTPGPPVNWHTVVGKPPLGRKSPGIVQSLQNKCYRLLVDCLLLVSSCVMLHVTGKTGALTHLRLNWEDSGSYRSCLEPGAELWKRKG